MEPGQVELQIAALLDHADVEQARVREAVTKLEATGAALREEVRVAAGVAVKEAFQSLQGDIERARGAMKWFSYRWFFITVATLAGVSALGFLVLWASLRWQKDEVQALLTQRAELQAQVAQLEGHVAELRKQEKALGQVRRVPKAVVHPDQAETE